MRELRMGGGESIVGEKFETLERMLQEQFVLVHIDPKAPAVNLPPAVNGMPTVTLRLSYYFQGSLQVSKDKVTTDLLFGSDYHTCEIPLQAIWGVTSESGNNIVWPDDAPPGVLEQFLALTAAEKRNAESEKAKIAPAKPKSRPTRKPRLGGPSGGAGHLRRVK